MTTGPDYWPESNSRAVNSTLHYSLLLVCVQLVHFSSSTPPVSLDPTKVHKKTCRNCWSGIF